MWFLRKKSDDQRRSVFVLTTGSRCRSPSVGDPRLAISVSISDVISDSLTNRSDPSSTRNLHPSRCPPAPNSNSYARIRLRSNGRLMMFQSSIRLFEAAGTAQYFHAPLEALYFGLLFSLRRPMGFHALRLRLPLCRTPAPALPRGSRGNCRRGYHQRSFRAPR
jgi:hypothetical protein